MGVRYPPLQKVVVRVPPESYAYAIMTACSLLRTCRLCVLGHSGPLLLISQLVNHYSQTHYLYQLPPVIGCVYPPQPGCYPPCRPLPIFHPIPFPLPLTSSTPSPSLPSCSPSLSLSILLLWRSGPLKPAKGLEDRCKLPQCGMWPQPTSIFVYSERENSCNSNSVTIWIFVYRKFHTYTSATNQIHNTLYVKA